MAKHDYIFVDESGDPGYKVDPESGQLLSSSFYIAAALHLSDDAFAGLNKHVASFRFYSGLSRELKIPPSMAEVDKLVNPIKMLAEAKGNIRASVVYLDKVKYTGSYLKPGGLRAADPVKFRNYVLRRLLKHHFRRYELLSNQYDLVLDRVETTRKQRAGLKRYLARDDQFPKPTYITHAASIYVEGLQIAHHIANGFKAAVAGQGTLEELSFVNARDLTRNE